MTIIIQALIVITALVVLRAGFSQRASHASRATKKVGLIVLAVSMIIAVVFPDVTNTAAKAVGVGRGADLLLYVTVAAFILYALNNYLQVQDQRDMLFRLARRLAIIEARTSNKAPKQ